MVKRTRCISEPGKMKPVWFLNDLNLAPFDYLECYQKAVSCQDQIMIIEDLRTKFLKPQREVHGFWGSYRGVKACDIFIDAECVFKLYNSFNFIVPEWFRNKYGNPKINQLYPAFEGYIAGVNIDLGLHGYTPDKFDPIPSKEDIDYSEMGKKRAEEWTIRRIPLSEVFLSASEIKIQGAYLGKDSDGLFTKFSVRTSKSKILIISFSLYRGYVSDLTNYSNEEKNTEESNLTKVEFDDLGWFKAIHYVHWKKNFNQIRPHWVTGEVFELVEKLPPIVKNLTPIESKLTTIINQKLQQQEANEQIDLLKNQVQRLVKEKYQLLSEGDLETSKDKEIAKLKIEVGRYKLELEQSETVKDCLIRELEQIIDELSNDLKALKKKEVESQNLTDDYNELIDHLKMKDELIDSLNFEIDGLISKTEALEANLAQDQPSDQIFEASDDQKEFIEILSRIIAFPYLRDINLITFKGLIQQRYDSSRKEYVPSSEDQTRIFELLKKHGKPLIKKWWVEYYDCLKEQEIDF